MGCKETLVWLALVQTASENLKDSTQIKRKKEGEEKKTVAKRKFPLLPFEKYFFSLAKKEIRVKKKGNFLYSSIIFLDQNC